MAVTETFTVTNPAAPYTLRIRSVGIEANVIAAIVRLNGVLITSQVAFTNPIVEFPIRLNSTNEISTELTGRPGTGIVWEVIGVDNDPPTISATLSPSPNARGWNNSNVTVTFICSDTTSGVASCPPPVVVASEGARSVAGTAVDNAGNAATTSVTVRVDKTAPTITAKVTPAPNGLGFNTSVPVTVTFTCADSLSGVAACSPPISITTPGLGRVVTGNATDAAGNSASAQATVNIATDYFVLRNVLGRCLTYGNSAGSPVFVRDCDGSASQQIRIIEVSNDHQVMLKAGTLVIGVHRDTSGGVIRDDTNPGPPPPPGSYPVELQTPALPEVAQVSNQRFLIDGDSVLLAADRRVAFQLQNSLTANGTSVIAGPRHTADAELWDFVPIDGSDRDPTTAFVRVGYPDDLMSAGNRLRALLEDRGASTYVHPNAVIKIASDAVIDQSHHPVLQVPSGVTIRGDRRFARLGPLLCKTAECDPSNPPDEPDGIELLEIQGDNVRITGLRLQGTSRSRDSDQRDSVGIYTQDQTAGDLAGHYMNTVIDHNDVSNFTGNGVLVHGSDEKTAAYFVCDPNANPSTRPANVLVARNFIHHNAKQNAGYGVEANYGGFPTVEGNVFVSNRHAIAAGRGTAHTGYRARFNLVLSDSALQEQAGGLITYRTQDFDMHGTDDDGFGGLGGDYVDVFANTFLANSLQGTNRRNYELRGLPCYDTDFHANVSLESENDAVVYKDSIVQVSDRILYENVASIPNQFNFANPTNRLAVGDFDGDGVQDTFIATGAAWYYAPQGNAEWRLLNEKTDRIGSLLFGDFDGDGLTDVVGISDGQLVISWAGRSPWQYFNSLPPGATISDMAVGDFIGDGRADIFYASGSSWYLSSGGTAPFTEVNTSSFRVKDLRFGDFDGDGKTDVFGVTSGAWSYSKSALGTWTRLQNALAPVDALVVADFDGDGRADVAMLSSFDFSLNPLSGAGSVIIDVKGFTWNIAYGGRENWTSHRVVPTSRCSLSGFPEGVLAEAGVIAAIGQFDASAGNDLLLWGSTHTNALCIVSGGRGALDRQSRQDMR